MSSPDYFPDQFPDEVPVADAVEQSVPATRDPEYPDDEPGGEDDPPPLESNESDWAEQRAVVGFDPEDDFR